MRFGLPSVQQGAKDFVIRVCASSAAFLVLGCWASPPLAPLKYWSSPRPGSRAQIGDVAGSTRQPIMTAYRQQALACAASLAEGPRRTSELRSVVPTAPSILLRNW